MLAVIKAVDAVADSNRPRLTPAVGEGEEVCESIEDSSIDEMSEMADGIYQLGRWRCQIIVLLYAGLVHLKASIDKAHKRIPRAAFPSEAVTEF